MPIYLDVDRSKMRATTNGVMAAIERAIGWLLWGPRQHESHRLLSLGAVSSTTTGERVGKR